MIRGRHISRPMDEIIDEAKRLVHKGVKEINVISQDTTYYGLDLYRKRMLPELLNRLAGVQGLEWLRLHYTYPDGFPLDLIDVMNDHDNICNYIDMPLQHISDRILKSMHRGMDGKSTRQLIETIRQKLPGVAFRTTLIAGYPGETEREFRELREFIQTSRFERLGIFTYSHEEDTAAFHLKNSVPQNRKDARVGELMELQEEISLQLNTARIGQNINVLIDRQEGDYMVGRTEFDSPEVDNEVLISRKNGPMQPGSFYTVRITGAESFDLMAELS
jgi:ribosomal protein S12 methylthiotransferase